MNQWQVWRKQQRVTLVARREAITEQIHRQWSMAISAFLKQGFPILKKMKIGFYWPFRGEYDPRPVANYFKQQGAIIALPEIIDRHEPLCFREWWHEAPMKNGTYGIPVPADTEQVMIDAVIVPMVGFDQQGYRLGYGHGYFDRTLSEYKPLPLTIGVAFEMLRMDSVHPQPHDIAMHFIVTEAGIYQTINHKLVPISTATCAIEHAISK